MTAWIALFITQVVSDLGEKDPRPSKARLSWRCVRCWDHRRWFIYCHSSYEIWFATAPAGINPLEFMMVPFADMLVFAVLFERRSTTERTLQHING
jgi:hypothetical protein